MLWDRRIISTFKSKFDHWICSFCTPIVSVTIWFINHGNQIHTRWQMSFLSLKFEYSEKHTNLKKFFHLEFDVTQNVQTLIEKKWCIDLKKMTCIQNKNPLSKLISPQALWRSVWVWLHTKTNTVITCVVASDICKLSFNSRIVHVEKVLAKYLG